MSDELFCFLDLETTGLDPNVCEIVEVACAITRADFVPFAEFESLVRVDIDPCAKHWEHFAWCMHHESKLLAEIGVDTVRSAPVVGRQLYYFLAEHLGTKRANLAGNSVHFDRSFIARIWPDVCGFFTHRHLDVSSLRLAGAASGREKPKQPNAHRAMQDVKASLVELAYWTRPQGAE